MEDGEDEEEVQEVDAVAVGAPAGAGTGAELLVPTVLVGGTWDRLEDSLRVEAESHLAADSVLAQAALSRDHPRLETVSWGRLDTFEEIQTLLDSLDRRGHDEHDLFESIEAWS